MSNEQLQHQPNDFHPNDIDLFDLVESIWKQKILIVIITAIFTSLAVAYALTAKPTYKATTTFYQPPASAIQAYNLGRKEADLPEYSISAVYDIFLTSLNSLQLRNYFFDEIYLPALSSEQQVAPRSSLFARFNQALSIHQVDPLGNKNLYQLTFLLEDADQAAQWANLYLKKAITLSKQELQEDISVEIQTRKESINLKIENLLAKAKAERLDEVIRLKEALSIAKAIGLENPGLPNGKSTKEGANYVDRNLTYMRGAKALQSQIHTLENRKDDHAFVSKLRDLSSQLNMLNSLSLNFDQAEVVKIDHEAVVPDTPIKPRKTLIVAAGIIFGGMVGVLFALIRTAIRQRKERAVQH